MRRYVNALVADMARRAEMVGIRLDALPPEDDIDSIPLEAVAREVVRHGRADAKRVLGLTDTDLVAGHVVDPWRQENVRLIKRFTEDSYRQMDELIDNSRGVRVEDIADQVEGLFGTTRRRAELIARDQTLKLNSQIQQEACRTAGVEEYIWSTSQDSSVRQEHEVLEGQRCRFDNPPAAGPHGEPGNPGEWYECRCIAVPVLPELEIAE